MIVLSDWAFEDPETIFRNIMLDPNYYVYYQRTVFDYLNGIREEGFAEANAELLPFRKNEYEPA